MDRRGFAPLIIVLILASAIAVGAVGYSAWKWVTRCDDCNSWIAPTPSSTPTGQPQTTVFGNSSNAKSAIEQQYDKERAAGAQNPAPKNPNAPYPIMSDQTPPDQIKTYRNNAIGFSFTYHTYQLDRLDGQIDPYVLTDNTSTLSFSFVAGDSFGVNLYDDPTKLKVRSYDPGTDDYDVVTYSPAERTWLVAATPSRGLNYGSPQPLCPEEQYAKTNVPYYLIGTDFHAGGDVAVFITSKNIIAIGGYNSNDNSISFDNPQSLLTANCKIAK